MREIKYRAWHKDKRKMFYPIELEWDDEGSDKNPKGLYIWRKPFGSEDVTCSGLAEHIDKCELMQYTGLKDKNDNEIYEGDIIKTLKYVLDKIYYEGTPNECATQKQVEHFQVVTWDISNARWRIGSSWIVPMSFALEVVGNVYENSDMLSLIQD